ncbi:unnamed protein product [Closterium sp. NIES-65]|nr:unnamed protein product [Closterium sp. NIES-65]
MPEFVSRIEYGYLTRQAILVSPWWIKPMSLSPNVCLLCLFSLCMSLYIYAFMRTDIGMPLQAFLCKKGSTCNIAARMATEREGNEIAEALRGLFGLVRGELTALKGELAMVREQVARQNERVLILEERNQVLGNEVNELRYALDVVGERSVATAAVVEERETALATLTEELNKVKAELTAVKGGLAEHKDVITEQLDMAERRRELELRELGEEVRKGEDEMRAELAREREERRREVQALDWPRAMEELTACRNWQNFELEMCRSDDRQIDAWKVSADLYVR